MVNKLFSFFSSRCFLKEGENMYSVFLSSYTSTRESLGELEKASHSISQHFSFSQTSTWDFYEVIVDEAEGRIYYRLIEIESE